MNYPLLKAVSQCKIQFLKKFCSDLVKALQDILKTLLDLITPHQYCQDAKSEASFKK